MPDLFPILVVDSAMRSDVEQLGSKPKFWFKYQGQNWLFKEARANTGEDWSEKIASEIARLMGLPTHQAELAVWEGKRGCAVKSFLTSNQSVLSHGNELLGGLITGYDKEKERGQSDHTIENIVTVIERLFPQAKARRNAASRMVGYLVFDALRILVELNNPATRLAVPLLTEDYQMIGWAPRYLVEDLITCVPHAPEVSAKIARINADAAPLNQRILVEYAGRAPRGSQPMSTPDFRPLLD